MFADFSRQAVIRNLLKLKAFPYLVKSTETNLAIDIKTEFQICLKYYQIWLIPSIKHVLGTFYSKNRKEKTILYWNNQPYKYYKKEIIGIIDCNIELF